MIVTLNGVDKNIFTMEELALAYVQLEAHQRDTGKRHWRVSTKMASLSASPTDSSRIKEFNDLNLQISDLSEEMRTIHGSMLSIEAALLAWFTSGAGGTAVVNPKAAVADCLDQARKRQVGHIASLGH